MNAVRAQPLLVQGESFFDNFNYYTGYDPAQGFVHYVPEVEAQRLVSVSMSYKLHHQTEA